MAFFAQYIVIGTGRVTFWLLLSIWIWSITCKFKRAGAGVNGHWHLQAFRLDCEPSIISFSFYIVFLESFCRIVILSLAAQWSQFQWVQNEHLLDQV